MGSFHMLNLLPCLTTFNIVEYINEIKLNKSCGVSSICIELHLICRIVCAFLPCHALFKPDMHHTLLCIMPCLCGGCLPCCLLLSGVLLRVGSVNVAFVRIRSTSSVCLLHGLVLLPCGISGKMTIPLKSLLSLLASCSFYRYVALPTTCYIMPPIL